MPQDIRSDHEESKQFLPKNGIKLQQISEIHPSTKINNIDPIPIKTKDAGLTSKAIFVQVNSNVNYIRYMIYIVF